MKRRHPRAKSTSQFIREAQEKHGDEYDYSQTEYQNAKTKVTILCPDHGLFEQLPHDHLRGKGCIQCGYIKTRGLRRRPSSEVIRQFRETHGDQYDYDLVEYINMETKVTILCKNHGPFEQRPDCHIKGYGCQSCGHQRTANFRRLSLEQILERFHAEHGDRYDYSEVRPVKNNRQKVRIICAAHGVFLQSVTKHASGSGCPVCCESRGERHVAKILDWMKLKYEREKRFSSCRDKKPLPFDFYVPSERTLIEYDGAQHQVASPRFDFATIRKHDRMKTAWAEEHGYRLIRIPHQSFNDIPIILSKKLPCQLSRSELN